MVRGQFGKVNKSMADLFPPKLVSAFKKDLEAVTKFLVGETKSQSKSSVKKATNKKKKWITLD